jgi:hypothetical protein
MLLSFPKKERDQLAINYHVGIWMETLILSRGINKFLINLTIMKLKSHVLFNRIAVVLKLNRWILNRICTKISLLISLKEIFWELFQIVGSNYLNL